ncbi:MAG: efflux RND transporter permease subunit, partial [Candidatus Polarisedimenticolia bacterium]
GLYIAAPKGFFPQQDTGRLTGSLVGSQDSSFQATKRRMDAVARIVMADPAVQAMVGFNGGGSATNTGRMFITLKPQSERKDAADQVIARLRKATASIPGGTLYLQAVQDVRVGGRSANAQYQYTLRGDDVQTLNEWVPVMLREVKRIKGIVDVSTDQQDGGLQARVVVDRETAARLGLTPLAIDNALYDAFGQRQVSTIYNTLNQYHVVLEADPKYWRSPVTLSQFSVATPAGAVVPLSAVAHFAPQTTSLSVAHQGQFPAVTISFNLAPGLALGQAVDAINDAARRVGLPATVQSSFQGTAQAFQQSLDNEALLILAALLTVYVVLGVLYESYVHPVTILSTLPSAGIGALLALRMTRTDLSVIALVGILLLIGIVKKNAILMIDFAIEAERGEGLAPTAAIYKACVLRFRPIMMTTMAALLGAVPLAFGGGVGSELRRPLGITIVGGLIASQALTLYTTPVVYLSLERLRLFAARARSRRAAGRAAAQSA